MNNTLTYKNYTAAIEFDNEDMLIYGRVLGINDRIIFYISKPEDAQKEFEEALDDYLEFCEEDGVPPNKPFSGKFTARVSPDLHRRAGIEAERRGVSLNKLLQEALEEKLAPTSSCPKNCHQDITNLGKMQVFLHHDLSNKLDQLPRQPEKSKSYRAPRYTLSTNRPTH